MLPLCLDQGVGVLPWKPLAAGRLAREWGVTTTRSDADETGAMFHSDGDRPIVDAVGKVAEGRGVPRAQVALAWLLAQPSVTAPVVGATRPSHLDDAVASVDLVLSEDEVMTLERHYRARQVIGF